MAESADILDWQAVPADAWHALAQAAGTANPFYAPAAVRPASIYRRRRSRALGEPLLRAGDEPAFRRAGLPLLAQRPGQHLRMWALDADHSKTRRCWRC